MSASSPGLSKKAELFRFRRIVFLCPLAVFLFAPLSAGMSESDRLQVDRALGTKGIYTPSEDTYRLTFPRTGVHVMINNKPLLPFTGLVSWAAMTDDPHHGGALVVAEFALFEDEVNPVLSVALDNGFEVTALHNHFLFDRPRVLFMHLSEFGEPPELAAKMRKILDKVKAIRRANLKPVVLNRSDVFAARSSITASVLDSILETHGQTEAGMYKASMGMRGLVAGIPAGKQMGLSTWIAFAGTDDKATVNGQIIMTQSQIQDVLRALLRAGINIAALDSPMIEDHPRFFFVHYWGKGRALELARGVRAALEIQLR